MGLMRDQRSDYSPWLETKSRSMISSKIKSGYREFLQAQKNLVSHQKPIGCCSLFDTSRIQRKMWKDEGAKCKLTFLMMICVLAAMPFYVCVILSYTLEHKLKCVHQICSCSALITDKRGVVRNSTGVFYLDNATSGHPPWFCFKFHMHGIQVPVRHLATPPSPSPFPSCQRARQRHLPQKHLYIPLKVLWAL